MRHYELTYIISPNLSEKELEDLQEKMNSFVLEEEGKIENSKNPIKRELKYSIKESGEAFLATLNFYLNPEKLENLGNKLKKERSILRFFILNQKRAKKIEIPKIKSRTKIKKEKKVKLEKIGEKLDEILGQI